jgi:hypothetical protein
MKKFFRENPTLAFGLALPLLMVVVFLIAAEIPEIGAVPPQNAVVFATNYYPNNRGINIRVENGKAHIVFIGDNNNYSTVPKIYVFTPSTNAVREIPITLPIELIPPAKPCCIPGKESDKVTPVSAPELEALKLDNSSIAPDGYEFTGYENYSRGFMGGLFFGGSSYREGVVLSKRGHKVHVPQAGTQYYGYNPYFIGWVVKP